MLKSFYLYLLLLISFSFTSWCEESTHSVAIVAPLTGNSKDAGTSIARGAQLYFDQIDKSSKIKIQVDLYDDKNDVEEAARQAKVMAQSDAIAVIGHNVSSTTFAGSKIYQREQIPLLVPTATNVDITLNNSWAYRIIYDDTIQSKSIIKYIKNILSIQEVSIVSSLNLYGSYIGKVFDEESSREGIKVLDHWKIKKDSSNIDQIATEIIARFKRGEELGHILLALHETDAVEIIRQLRDAGIKNTFVGPDSLSSLSFQERFKDFPLEIKNPGFYTNGLMVASPYIQDIANREAQMFYHEYREKFGVAPDWRAAYAYDCAKVLHKSLIKALEKPDQNSESIADIRNRVREELSFIDTASKAIEGVTGNIYFGEQDSSLKPVNIGVFQKGKTVSALWQLKEVPNPQLIENLSELLKLKEIIKIGENYFYKTDIVYTGVKIESIENVNVNEQRCDLTFLLWLRHPKTSAVPEDILFTNALGEIEQFDLIRKVEHSIYNYQLYRCKGTFFIDYKSKEKYQFNKHLLGIQFRHKNLSSDKIFYVPDLSEMSVLSKKAINLSSDWKVLNFIFYKNSYFNTALGDPLYINQSGGIYEQIQFNSEVEILQEFFSLRGKLSKLQSTYLAPLSALLFFLLVVFFKKVKNYSFLGVILLFKVILLAAALLSLEVLLVDWAVKSSHVYNLNMTRTLFDIFYWVLVAYAVIQFVKLFLFYPIEIKAEKKIPAVVKGGLYFVIHLLTFFAITSFVFQKPLTGILATSGLFAMIIGLAIKFNLSNVFSGIILNLERPFQIGDYVQIGSTIKGRILDMSWRSTKIKALEGKTIWIPNSCVAEELLTKFEDEKKNYKYHIKVYVGKEHPVDQVKRVLMEGLNEVEGIEEQDACFREVTDWAYYYKVKWKSQDFSKRYKVKEAVYEKIFEKFAANNINFALRNQEITIKKKGDLSQESCL